MTDLEFITEEIANLEQSLAHAAKMGLKYPAIEERLAHLKRIRIKLKFYERWKDQIKDKYKTEKITDPQPKEKTIDITKLPCNKCEWRYSIHCPKCEWNKQGKVQVY